MSELAKAQVTNYRSAEGGEAMAQHLLHDAKGAGNSEGSLRTREDNLSAPGAVSEQADGERYYDFAATAATRERPFNFFTPLENTATPSRASASTASGARICPAIISCANGSRIKD